MIRAIRKYGTLVGIIAVILFFWINIPDTFMTARNWLNITEQLSMLMVVAAGMKISYDLLLWNAFRHVKPPEERVG